MNLSASALVPASNVPDEEVALDGALAQLREAMEVLDLDHLDRLSGDSVLTVLSKTAALGRGVEAILTAVSNEVAVRSDPSRGSEGLAALLNFAKPSHLVEMVAGVSAAAASRLIRVGSRICPRTSDAGLPLPPLFPAVGEALRAGKIGLEAVEVITRELSLAAPRAQVTGLTVAENELVSQATGGADLGLPLPPDLIAIQARQWRDVLDENGIEPRAEKAFQDRDFWISRTPKNGLVKFGGQVTVDVGAKLLALFDAVLNTRTTPRYLPTGDTGDEDGADAPRKPTTEPGETTASADTTATATSASTASADTTSTAASTAANADTTTTAASDTNGRGQPGDTTDISPPADTAEPTERVPRETRTPGQIRADVFAAMIDSLARSDDAPTLTGAAPTVVVKVTAEVLNDQKGTGQIVGITDPVPYSTIQQILCDGSVLPAIINPDGALVALGAEQRLFARSQRMGMIARDGPTCGIEGCTIPASGCEAHHIIEYANGGATHTDNGALYCWFHHRMIDTGVFTVEMVDGKPKVTIPDWLQRKPYFH